MAVFGDPQDGDAGADVDQQVRKQVACVGAEVAEVGSRAARVGERLVAQLLQQERGAADEAAHLVLLFEREAQALLEQVRETERAATRCLHHCQPAHAAAAAVQALGLDEVEALFNVRRLKLRERP